MKIVPTTVSSIPKLYFGTMTLAWKGQTSSEVDSTVALEMMKRFAQTNQAIGVSEVRIDTARVYAGGATEPMVGSCLAQLDVGGQILVGTKAHPSVGSGLSPDGIGSQMEKSLEEMKLSSVHEYYLHQPDTGSSLLESLKFADSLVKEGKVEVVGMSNYHVSEVKRAYELCKEHGLTKPTVYQGLYNPINRLVEDELIPTLHEHGASFVAYNPLAAGLLTGKHKRVGKDDDVAKGRFFKNPNYLPRFYTEKNFDALELISDACQKASISMVDATFHWLLRHSDLNSDDGILLGASSLAQLDQNLEACTNAAKDVDSKTLTPELLEAFDKAWEITKETSFPYWRSYSSDHPNREALDQGASYNAAKTK